MHTRRTFLTMAAATGVVCLSRTARAQALPKPFIVYDDELKNGWQNRSWAKVALSTPAGGSKPIKVEGDPWSALSLYHDAFSTAGFSKLTFFINGGKEGGQHLMVKVMAGGKAIDANFLIQPKVKTWTVVEVPLKELGAEGKMIDGIIWQGQANAFSAFYIARIQFE
jgi:hypothetical protein